MYDLPPNTKYYVWVDQAAKPSTKVTSNMIWGILQRGASAPVTLGYVIKCHPSGSSNKSSELGFSYCQNSPTKDLQALARNASTSSGIFSFVTRLFERSSAAATESGETWFECDPGCCTGTRVTQ